MRAIENVSDPIDGRGLTRESNSSRSTVWLLLGGQLAAGDRQALFRELHECAQVPAHVAHVPTLGGVGAPGDHVAAGRVEDGGGRSGPRGPVRAR